jgi:imidazolonepropionase
VILIHHIGLLAGVRGQSHLLKGEDLRDLPCLENAWILIDNGRIAAYGAAEEDWKVGAPATSKAHGTGRPDEFPETGRPGELLAAGQADAPLQEIDALGATVLPCWCDSHTHLVFAGSREHEFVDKLKGATYAEIAAGGGGILNSARLLRETDEDTLYEGAWQRLQECIRLGTGAIEIKSGYGLDVESEIKMLRVIRRLKQNAPIPIKATFLGAHALPGEYKDDRPGYIALVTETMLPRIIREGLADYIDVFCEEGFFSPEETLSICEAGRRHGLGAKIHANQLHCSGGVQAGVRAGAISVDHLETVGETEIECLRGTGTIATLLPGAAFFLRLPYPPARAMIEGDLPIALASDYNPGSCPSGNMNMVVSLACIQMKLLPEEAINAATLNGAYAMGLGQEAGSVTEGKRANLIFMKPLPSLAYLPYAFGSNCIDRVMINGVFID